MDDPDIQKVKGKWRQETFWYFLVLFCFGLNIDDINPQAFKMVKTCINVRGDYYTVSDLLDIII